MNNLLHRTLPQVWPSSEVQGSLSHTSPILNHVCSFPHIPLPVTPPNFFSFTPVIMDEISKLPSDSLETNCDLDPIPTSLLKNVREFSSLLSSISVSQLAFSQISSRIVQSILISRSLVLTKKILPINVNAEKRNPASFSGKSGGSPIYLLPNDRICWVSSIYSDEHEIQLHSLQCQAMFSGHNNLTKIKNRRRW